MAETTWDFYQWITQPSPEFWWGAVCAFITSGIGIFGFGRFCGRIEEKHANLKMNKELQEIATKTKTKVASVTGIKVVQLPQGLPSFTEKPFINPALLRELSGWISDSSPVIRSIDIVGAQKSNRYTGDVKSHGQDEYPYVVFEPSRGSGDPPQSYSYQYLGCSPSGIHALRVADHGGGSGVFHSVIFVCFTEDDVLQPKNDEMELEKRYALKYLGEVGLGDRPIIEELSFVNGVLRVGNISFVGSEAGQKPRSIKID